MPKVFPNGRTLSWPLPGSPRGPGEHKAFTCNPQTFEVIFTSKKWHLGVRLRNRKKGWAVAQHLPRSPCQCSVCMEAASLEAGKPQARWARRSPAGLPGRGTELPLQGSSSQARASQVLLTRSRTAHVTEGGVSIAVVLKHKSPSNCRVYRKY